MAIIEQISCDMCGKVKQAVNHWWMTMHIGGALRFEPFDRDITGKQHLCGQECAIKALSEWMASQSEQSK